VAAYPRSWLERGDGEPATDLDLAVLLVNSFDLLEDPPDRLTDLRWFTEALRDEGHGDMAQALRPADLRPLRALRDDLRSVFEAASPSAAAAILNPLLAEAGAVPQLVVIDGHAELQVSPADRGLKALASRLPAALAVHIAAAGVTRLGTCAADPCRCAFVDHTRGRTRRYCCTMCNDRMAARLYRERKRPR
jgi:predicted RNA-binding Zn ribbon-like protein